MSVKNDRLNFKETLRLNIWGNYFGFVVMGMIVVSFGSIMPYIRDTFSLTFEQGGMMLAFFSGSYLVNGMISGFLVDKFGQKPVLVVGNALYVIGLTTIYFAHEPWMLYLSVVIIGTGWGFCNTTVNILVNDTSKGETKAMSLLHMSFGVGAFFIPLFFSFLLRMGFSWRHMMLFLALMSLVALLLSIKMKIRQKNTDKPQNETNKKETSASPKILLLYMIILFFYVGGENAFNGWVVSYLMTGLHKMEGFSQNILSTLWLTIILGRYMIGLLNHRIDKAKFVMIASFMALTGMSLFILAKSEWLIFLSIICIGLSISGIYPLTMAHANRVIHGSGLATAIVISGGGLGATIIPYVSGRIADYYGTIAIIGTVLISWIGMSIFTVLNYFIHKEKRSNQY